MWTSHLERALKLVQQSYTLAVENLNSHSVASMPVGTLLACCQELAAMGKEASAVQSIHFTPHDKLGAHPELFSTLTRQLRYGNILKVCEFVAGQSSLDRSCSQLSTYNLPQSPTGPLSQLLACFSNILWGIHATRDLSDCAELHALNLFDDYNSRMSAGISSKAQKPSVRCIDFDKLVLFNGLRRASIFSINQIVGCLVEAEGCHINQKGSMGFTPLAWAAWNGHEAIVKLLLGRADIDPDKPHEDGRTPLMLAACNGHEGVVKMLLGRDGVNPDKPDNEDETPLYRAAINGHAGVVEILLGRGDVDPNQPCVSGQTPLFWAALYGYEGVVKILLGRSDVNPDKPDITGQTPLSCAAEKGHIEVVEILLRQDDVNPNYSDEDGQTPLYCATKSGHSRVVEMLLGRNDVNPNYPNKDGQTPLFQAACRGDEGIAKILLGRDDINPHKPDNRGQTPLSCAAEYQHARVVEILYSAGAMSTPASQMMAECHSRGRLGTATRES